MKKNFILKATVSRNQKIVLGKILKIYRELG